MTMCRCFICFALFAVALSARDGALVKLQRESSSLFVWLDSLSTGRLGELWSDLFVEVSVTGPDGSKRTWASTPYKEVHQGLSWRAQDGNRHVKEQIRADQDDVNIGSVLRDEHVSFTDKLFAVGAGGLLKGINGVRSVNAGLESGSAMRKLSEASVVERHCEPCNKGDAFVDFQFPPEKPAPSLPIHLKLFHIQSGKEILLATGETQASTEYTLNWWSKSSDKWVRMTTESPVDEDFVFANFGAKSKPGGNTLTKGRRIGLIDGNGGLSKKGTVTHQGSGFGFGGRQPAIQWDGEEEEFFDNTNCNSQGCDVFNDLKYLLDPASVLPEGGVMLNVRTYWEMD